VGISVPPWRPAIRSWYPSITWSPKNVSYNDLRDLYLDKLNKNHLTRNLVHRLERLGYSVTLAPSKKPHRLLNFHDSLDKFPGMDCLHRRVTLYYRGSSIGEQSTTRRLLYNLC